MTNSDTTHPSGDEHADIMALLDEAGRREQQDLAKAQVSDVTAGDAEEAFARQLHDSAQHSARPPRSQLALAAAALVVVSLVAWVWGPWTSDRSNDVLLGDDITLVRPLGTVPEFVDFAFEADLVGDVFAVIRVYDDTQGALEPLTESSRLREPQWTPDVDTSSWSAIRWTVTVYEGASQAESIAGPVEAKATRDS